MAGKKIQKIFFNIFCQPYTIILSQFQTEISQRAQNLGHNHNNAGHQTSNNNAAPPWSYNGNSGYGPNNFNNPGYNQNNPGQQTNNNNARPPWLNNVNNGYGPN